jgi:ABC-type branched-subunit amino acid transport system substrate-binding protein
MKRRFVGIILGLIVGLMSFGGCEWQKESSSMASGQDENGNWIFDDVVTVGRVVPKSGVRSSFGIGTPYVETMAIDALNEQGGVVLDGKRCKLELKYMDSLLKRNRQLRVRES